MPFLASQKAFPFPMKNARSLCASTLVVLSGVNLAILTANVFKFESFVFNGEAKVTHEPSTFW
jgi:hypothetical protein